MSGYSSNARKNPAQIRDSNRFDSVPIEKMPSLSGGGAGLKMECPIKFLLVVELISVQLMADHLFFKSFVLNC